MHSNKRLIVNGTLKNCYSFINPGATLTFKCSVFPQNPYLESQHFIFCPLVGISTLFDISNSKESVFHLVVLGC